MVRWTSGFKRASKQLGSEAAITMVKSQSRNTSLELMAFLQAAEFGKRTTPTNHFLDVQF